MLAVGAVGVREFASAVHAQSYQQIVLQPGSIIKLGSYEFVQLDALGTLMALESIFLCPTGSYVDNGSCQLCATGLNNCAACASATQCHTCDVGYHLENFNCVPDCDGASNCDSCSSPNYCSPTGCQSGYFTNTSTGQCDDCSSLDGNCLTCSNSATCDTCATGYFPDGASCTDCTDVLDHCISCSSSAACLTCETGYHLSSGSCVPDCGVTNCSSCSFPNYCSDDPGSCAAEYYPSGGDCLSCSTAIAGCDQCSDSSTCTTCRPGYILEANGTCTPTGTVADCSAYSSPDICDSCSPGYYLDSNSCTSCDASISNCSTCNYASATLVCDSCDPGYSLDPATNTCVMDCNPLGGNCGSCAAPNYCAPNGCNTGYFSSGGICTSCSSTLSHCTSCTDGTTCDTCAPGYHVEAGVCVLDCNPLGGNCHTCSAPDYCAPTGCDLGYTANLTTGQCEMNCSVPNCASSSSCYGPNQCGTCNSGYYPNSANGMCNACSGLHPDCLTCINSSTCTACGGASYLNGTTCESCATAMTGCNACTDGSTCTSCAAGYNLIAGACIPTGTDPQCNVYVSPNYCSPTGCNGGYYHDGGVCNACTPGCGDCADGSSCNTCHAGHYLDAGACTACTITLPGCNACTDGSTCTSCAAGYNLIAGACVPTGSIADCTAYSDPDVCSTCNTGYYLNANTCPACTDTLSNCLSCSSAGNCTACATNTILQASECHACSSAVTNCDSCDGTACTGCSSGHYLDAGACSSCDLAITGCDICSDSSTCTTCRAGYILETNGTCTPTGSIPNCTTYSTPGSCSACATGYTLNSGTNSCDMNCTTLNCNTCSAPDYCSPAGCDSGYFSDSGSCSTCSSTIPGCTVCSSGAICTACDTSAGYVLDGATCRAIPAAPANLTIPPTIYNGQTIIISWDPATNATGYILERSCNSSEWNSIYQGASPSATSNLDDCDAPVQYRVKAYNTLTTIVSPYTTSPPQNFTPCSTNCDTCADSSTCTTCTTGYTLDPDTNTCIMNCNPTGGNCNTCTSPDYCSPAGCNTGYYFASGVCSSCATALTGCTTCTDAATCSSCATGYYLDSDTCSSCSVAMTGCTTCSDSSTCATCAAGYNLIAGTCVPTGTVPNCTAYYAPDQCSTCNTGYYLNGSTCPACSDTLDDCLTCTSAGNCTSCAPNTILQSDECYECSEAVANCNACDGTACTGCSSGHYLDAGTCPSCSSAMTGCATCSGASTCTACESGYNFEGGICVPTGSVANCTTYSAPNTCSTCAAGYTLDDVGNTCEMNCNPTGGNCSACASPDYCSPTGCDSGYFSDNGTCSTCASSITGCTTCDSGTACTSCGAGYVLDADDCRVIPPAPANLTLPTTIYNGQTITISWDTSANATGYILERSCNSGEWNSIYQGASSSATNNLADCEGPVQYRVKAYNTLITIASSYTISPLGSYAACSVSNCDKCSDASTCTTCTTGYIVNGDTCVPTGSVANCTTYSQPEVCSTCESGYHLIANACWSTAPGGANGMNMQDFTANYCDRFVTPAPLGYTLVGTLTDTRDSKSYEVRKFADGNCWMADNLAYGGDTTSGGTDECDGKTTFDGCGDGSGQVEMGGYLCDGGDSKAGSAWGYGDCRDPKVLGEDDIAGANSYCTTGEGAGKCGYLYNWQAAVQLPDAYYGGIVFYPNGAPSLTDFHQGICPAGWHLPSGSHSSADSEFTQLHLANGADDAFFIGFANCESFPATCDFWRPGHAYNSVYAGQVYDVSSLIGQGLDFRQWSASDNSRYDITMVDKANYLVVDDAQKLLGTNHWGRHHGFTVRCLKNSNGCPANCASCSSATSCNQCSEGYTMSGGVCVHTGPVANCSTYSDPATCSKCVGEYVLAGNTCVPTGNVANCATYSQHEVCSACENGYSLDNGQCVACSNYTTAAYSGLTMQNFTTAQCNSVTTPEATCYALVGTFRDTRDNKTYEVRKFADGKCWMVDNLKYGGATDACAAKTTFAGDVNKSGSAWGYGDCRNNPGTNYGYLYNWQAAMQHASAYYNNNYTGPAANVQGICPTGWHLPSGSNTSGEFSLLDQASRGTDSRRSCSDAPCTFFRPGYNFKGVYAGTSYDDGTLQNQGSRAYWWSSTQISSYASYNLSVYPGGLYPDNYGSKEDGFSVRCIKN